MNMYMEDLPAYELNTEEQVLPCLRFIDEGQGGTLVVCTAGMSRSATICIAYMMKYRGYSYDQAFALAKKARFYVNPNSGFIEYLKSFEKELVTFGSRLEPKQLSKKCELCALERKTQWFPNHSETESNLFFQLP